MVKTISQKYSLAVGETLNLIFFDLNFFRKKIDAKNLIEK